MKFKLPEPQCQVHHVNQVLSASPDRQTFIADEDPCTQEPKLPIYEKVVANESTSLPPWP